MIIKRFWPKVWLAFLYILAACSISPPAGEEPQVNKDKENSSRFIRLSRDEKKQPLALESAIVRYVPKDRSKKAPIVDLVTAVHIGEKSYYQQLNREFEGYDAVLYELIAPEGTRIPKGGGAGSGSFISMIQKAMKDVLELDFQLQLIDYTRPNLLHADMSPDQFAQSMNKRGESMFSMFIRMMISAMNQQDPQQTAGSDLRLLMAIFDKNRAMALKRVMAEQFQSMDGMLSAVEGADGSTLISERNKVALDVLRTQIAEGKKKLAIFYGGGHMPDFDKRLRDQFGLVPVSTRWLTAWNLKTESKPAPPENKHL
ncbi:MAG: hypothetical protein ABSA77_13080 [Thermoguttaceae bacterium]|jgi:hypothetical protein